MANDAIRLEQNDFTVTPKRCEAEAIRTTPVTVELINGGAVKNQFFSTSGCVECKRESGCVFGGTLKGRQPNGT